MDREFVAFVGAGVQVLAAGLDCRVPQGAVRKGYEFVEGLVSFGDHGMRDLVLGVAEDIWREWRRAGLPQVVAREHLKAMPDILERFATDQTLLEAVLPRVDVGGDSLAADRDRANRFAQVIVERAGRADVFDDDSLSKQLSFFFLTRLFYLLLTNRRVIRDMRAPMRAYFGSLERSGTVSSAPDGPGIGASVLAGDLRGPEIRLN